MVITGIPAVMKIILYVRATVVAAITRRVRAVAAVKAARLVRMGVQTMCPCRIFARRRDVATIAIVAVPGMANMAASAFAAMYVIIAGSMRCAVAAIVAETECIMRKRRLLPPFLSVWVEFI